MHAPDASTAPAQVLHRPDPVSRMGREALWLYAAAGSGLWFEHGSLLEFSDTLDLARHLNATWYRREKVAVAPHSA